ncbi:MAG: hypothetical protein RL301_459 [Actinomycetota bacterium]
MANIFTTARQSWRNQSPAARLLRLWLGLTWIYGGWVKANDPGFLTPGATTYIGNEIQGFAVNSPLAPLLSKSLEHATAIGWLTLLGEFATGVATLFFIMPRFAALVGFATSIGLWLTVTFNVSPYFLGSDTAYAVLWGAYFLILNGNNKRISVDINRRGAMRFVSGLAVVGGLTAVAKLFPKKVEKKSTGSGIVKVTDLQVNHSVPFKSASGTAAILFRTNNGFFAYSSVCTHQGCLVQYNSVKRELHCPCHGAAFDPYNGAKVIQGPATRPLPAIKVKVVGDWVVEA